MNISTKLGAAVLALASVATACTTVRSQPGRSGRVYLVGVAGGG
jgi:hypothetical protein